MVSFSFSVPRLVFYSYLSNTGALSLICFAAVWMDWLWDTERVCTNCVKTPLELSVCGHTKSNRERWPAPFIGQFRMKLDMNVCVHISVCVFHICMLWLCVLCTFNIRHSVFIHTHTHTYKYVYPWGNKFVCFWLLYPHPADQQNLHGSFYNQCLTFSLAAEQDSHGWKTMH